MVRLSDLIGKPQPAGEATDRWSYSQFGLAFKEKYDHLRFEAETKGVLSIGDMREKHVAAKIGLNQHQWSNLRTKNPPVKAKIRRASLVALATHFKVSNYIGDGAWELFLSSVPCEIFKEALIKARYGTRRSASVKGQYVMPTADRYILKCPATLEQYDQTADISRVEFGADLIDLEADRQSFLRNQYGMVVLVDAWTGGVLGWVDIYHLPNEDFDRMKNEGKVVIDPARVVNIQEMGKATRGYTASILIDKDYRGHGLARYLIYGLIEFLLRFQFQEEDSFELFAVGQEDEGVELLQRFGFTHLRNVKMEEEEKPLYSRQFRQDDLLSEKWGFWSKYGIYRTDVLVDIKNPLAPADDLLLS